MQLRQLLVVIDPSQPSQPALQRAHWLARATSAKVELLLCEYNSALSHSLIFDSDTLASARARLAERHDLSRIIDDIDASVLGNKALRKLAGDVLLGWQEEDRQAEAAAAAQGVAQAAE